LSDWEKQSKQLQILVGTFADTFSDNEVIYHYTSAEGLRGIIESNEIWLTNTAFVNDTEECRTLQKSNNLFNDNDFNNSYIENHWNTFVKKPDESNNHYMASFSMKRDSLEQWRAYGNFCIGFNANNLVNLPFNLYKCVYSDQEIKDWILQKGKAAEWQGGFLDDNYKGAAAFHLIYVASRKHKSKYYKAEEEVRLIAVSNHTWGWLTKIGSILFEKDPPIHFRNHPAHKVPIPYVKFFISSDEGKKDILDHAKETFIQMQEGKLTEEKNKKREKLPIKEILIGPMLNQTEAKVACEILLKAKGHEDVAVNVSEIPYRGF
jgi:hypothetical protein